ncbi:MAG: N4-gp56 family major capsid protein [Mesotoga sp.]|nr:N4-gp56 family major capsid protein [Mesotoga sp.]
MGKTAFTTDNALTKKLWEEKLFRDMVKESYFSRFMGSGSDTIVQVKDALTKSKGDEVTFGIRMRLSGTGVTDGQVLEGAEEALVTYDDKVTLHQYRHAVRDNGALDRQRAMFDIEAESVQALSDWGSEKIDSLAFDAILDSPTRIFYKTSSGSTSTTTAATAKAALTAADGKITPAFVSYIKAYAKGGGSRTIVPIRPVKVEGKNYYVLLVHPDAVYDWKNDPTVQQFLREAEVRGPTNPLFTGAVAIYDGVVIHEHENIPIDDDGGSGAISWSKGVFMGAQSLVWAWGKRVETVQKKFDYDNEWGHAWGIIAGTNQHVFNSLDYGSLGVYVARTDIN